MTFLPRACLHCGATPERVESGDDPKECWERNTTYTLRGTYSEPADHLFVTVGGRCRECGADEDHGKPITAGWCAACYVEAKC